METYDNAKSEIDPSQKLWTLTFTVEGEPQSWQRARPVGMGRVGKSLNTGYQTQVKWSAKAAMSHQHVQITSLPLVIDVTFRFVPPTSWSMKKRLACIRGEIACVVRNDVDNLVKNICDGLNGIAFDDDHQVVEVMARRQWADRSRVLVALSQWQPSASPRAD